MAKRAKTNVLTPAAERRMRLRLGPGTILAVIAAAALFVSGKMAEPKSQSASSGRMIFEADAAGRMRRVDAPTAAQTDVPPLWKPEPQWALQHKTELRISANQQKRLAALNALWRSEKAALLESMDRSTGAVSATASPREGRHGASINFIQTGLSDFSGLSRQFDARRTEYWRRALGLLTPAQQAHVAELARRGGSR